MKNKEEIKGRRILCHRKINLHDCDLLIQLAVLGGWLAIAAWLFFAAILLWAWLA